MIRIESPNQSPLHRLLGGWREVHDDIRTLCATVADIPDACPCGDGAAHLNGRCPCCGTVAMHKVPACRTCDEQLERLRPAIDVLTVDRSRFLSFVHEVLGRHDPGAAVRVNTIDRQITALSMTFQRLLMAETRFRTDCRLSHMRDLKDAAAALSSDANALDEVMD